MAPVVAVVLLALCSAVALPSPAAGSRQLATEFFEVQGLVFCDTCKAGFETPVTTLIPGSKVRVECKDRETHQLTFTAEGLTDAAGAYSILVANDHQKDICESVLVSSPQKGCSSKLVPGRDRAPVVLTHNNGMPSYVRFANSMGFESDVPLSACDQVMKMYQTQDEDV